MEKTCLRCGKPFEAERHLKKYCSDTCRQYAYLERHGMQIKTKEKNTYEASNDSQRRITELESKLELLQLQVSVLSAVKGKEDAGKKETQEVPLVNALSEVSLPASSVIPVKQEKPSEKSEVVPLKIVVKNPFTKYNYPKWKATDFKNAAWANERIKSHFKRIFEIEGKEKHIKYVKYIIEGFQKIWDAKEYKMLPVDYPYKAFIKKVVSCLKQFVRTAKQSCNGRATLFLDEAMRSPILSAYREIGNSVPDINHSIPPKAKKKKAIIKPQLLGIAA